jgi:hypothetical protein
MAESDNHYVEQKKLDEKLMSLGVVSTSGEQHMSTLEFSGKLTNLKKEIKGYRVYIKH